MDNPEIIIILNLVAFLILIFLFILLFNSKSFSREIKGGN